MRESPCIEPMLDLIEKLWNRHPDFRLCQLISNCLSISNIAYDLYYVEDEVLFKSLEKMEEMFNVNGR